MVVSFVHFLAMLLIAGALIRLVQSKTADTTIGRALTFIY